ncbi:ribosome small subunit-dependent GTPase A [Cohnella lubricantis]|uniref:Small ribosomal subunit biogenesis GTPase RsgA n=1 Tax=Cohnella lubricantis TaxID=2163172 RepID=A0A841T6N6_9BACL|nr:ribosome small subunit-dependent GTPase A [Cohnella lubricantis]MBB6677203.1 ribosome small subunit-dependent GTPase A [Cohnella lubricantis]MBP2116987.1 ribosome biogenesis GTPase [Cohnella lubricantis]
MPEGIIYKALSGYYFVEDDSGRTVQCRARGIFKKRGESPLVGDRVLFAETENGEGTVDAIQPRSTALVRPPVANADLAVLVFSVIRPELNLQLLDKFLVHTEHAGLDALIVLTKMDATADSENADRILRDVESARSLYTSIGYDTIVTSAKMQDGIDELRERLSRHISVFAGQSGVGKSSLVNALVPGLQLETNEISEKLGRGRHTTRHVELVKMAGGGYVADTPGFSQLDFAELGIDQISDCFREFRELASGCKFRGCTHLHEPGCAVMAARESGGIAESRYQHYAAFMAEWKENRRRY